jgi:hypothetical protein
LALGLMTQSTLIRNIFLTLLEKLSRTAVVEERDPDRRARSRFRVPLENGIQTEEYGAVLVMSDE